MRRASILVFLALSALGEAVLPRPPAPARHGTLQFKKNGNVTRVTFNHPPINLVDSFLVSDLFDFLSDLIPSNRTTPPPKVVVFDSANPDYFLGHIDVSSIQQPLTPEKEAFTLQYIAVANLFNSITSTIFIAEMNGRAFGAGQELTVQMDMRFAGPNARAGSFENALGLVAGGGGQLFLGTLMNRGLALEYLLAAKTFDGPTGKALGLFNNYYGTAKELRNAVDALTARIGIFPAAGLNETKSALSFRNPTADQLNADVIGFYELDPLPAEQENTNTTFELGLTDSALVLDA
ncbi:enoyl- hydratase protein [Rutstroemia sp. NJR-2017a BBW]|nr:enoyl- hydratase protein [Rutstroemia sp. NJR-2017a BBW]